MSQQSTPLSSVTRPLMQPMHVVIPQEHPDMNTVHPGLLPLYTKMRNIMFQLKVFESKFIQDVSNDRNQWRQLELEKGQHSNALRHLQNKLDELESRHRDSNGVFHAGRVLDSGIRPEYEQETIVQGQGELTFMLEGAHRLLRHLMLEIEKAKQDTPGYAKQAETDPNATKEHESTGKHEKEEIAGMHSVQTPEKITHDGSQNIGRDKNNKSESFELLKSSMPAGEMRGAKVENADHSESSFIDKDAKITLQG